jgi:hypothetical protein
MKNRWKVALAGLLVIVAALGFQGDLRAAATGLTANVTVTANGTYSSTVDLATAAAQFNLSKTMALTFGGGASQSTLVFTDTRSTAIAEDLDVNAGALTDAFGNVFTLTDMKALVVCASSANTTNVLLGGDAASVPFLDTAATTTTIKPGGCRVFTDPSATGIVVTAATGDIIQVAPSAGTVAYDILIIGAAS